MGYTKPETKRAWTDKNRDAVNARQRAAYAANREQRLAGQRLYNEREREAISARRKAQYQADPLKYRCKAMKAKHGISCEEYEEILSSQGGVCAVCGTDKPGGKSTTFHIDHDHACCGPLKSCGKCRRGLLCGPCNVGIGMLQDSPFLLHKAAEYISVKNSLTRQPQRRILET